MFAVYISAAFTSRWSLSSGAAANATLVLLSSYDFLLFLFHACCIAFTPSLVSQACPAGHAIPEETVRLTAWC